jgi:hypothetical protein
MVAAMEAMSSSGARVIVDDLVFTDEPKFEDGPIALAARRFVGSGGVYVTSAGNFARIHYVGTYKPHASPTYRGFASPAVHAFSGQDFGNSLRIPAGADLIVVLQWNDPFGQASDDFDLVLARPAAGGDVVLAASTDMQAGSGNPYEALRDVNGSAPVDAYLASRNSRASRRHRICSSISTSSAAPRSTSSMPLPGTASSATRRSKRCCPSRQRRPRIPIGSSVSAGRGLPPSSFRRVRRAGSHG